MISFWQILFFLQINLSLNKMICIYNIKILICIELVVLTKTSFSFIVIMTLNLSFE